MRSRTPKSRSFFVAIAATVGLGGARDPGLSRPAQIESALRAAYEKYKDLKRGPERRLHPGARPRGPEASTASRS